MDTGHIRRHRSRLAVASVLVVLAAVSTAPPQAARAQAQTPAADQQFAKAVLVIRRLEAEGFESEARKKTQALVEQYPNRDVPEDIRALDQPIGWWRQFKGYAGPPLRVAAEMLLAAALLMLLAKAAVALVDRLQRAFTVAGVTGPVAEDAAGQSDVLTAELAKLADDCGSSHLRWSSAADGDFSLPDAVATAYPQTAIIGAAVQLLDRTIPRRLVKISAAVLPAEPRRGLGLTVTIANRSGRRADDGTVTLRESDFWPVDDEVEPAVRIERLMLPAAVWLAYHVTLRTKETVPLGTAEWTSYAHFAVGERAQRRGETVAARRSYYKALDLDACNIGARLNLAGLLLYRPDEDHDPRRSSRLAFAYWLLEDPSFRSRIERACGDREHLRWLYLCAARNLVAGSLAPAEDAVRHLMEELAVQRAGLGSAMRVPATVLRESIALEQEARRHPGADMVKLVNASEERMRAEWWSADTLYNLACFVARAAAHERHPSSHRWLIDRAATYLCDAIDRAPEPKLMAAMARRDDALTAVIAHSEAKVTRVLGGEDPDRPSVDRGHAIGVQIREALRTVGRPDGRG